MEFNNYEQIDEAKESNKMDGNSSNHEQEEYSVQKVPLWKVLRERQQFLWDMSVYCCVFKMTRIVDEKYGEEIAFILTGTVHVNDFMDHDLPLTVPWYYFGKVFKAFEEDYGRISAEKNELLKVIYDLVGEHAPFCLLTKISARYSEDEYEEVRDQICAHAATLPLSDCEHKRGSNKRLWFKDETVVMRGSMDDVDNAINICLDINDVPITKKLLKGNKHVGNYGKSGNFVGGHGGNFRK